MDGSNFRSLLLTAVILGLSSSSVCAEEAQWIWESGTSKNEVREGAVCYFRKTINLRAPAIGRVTIAADDRYQLFVNGHSVGEGRSARQLDKYDISRFLTLGRNVVAVQVRNTNGNTAALAARVRIQANTRKRWYTFSTDASWKAHSQVTAMWNKPLFNDRLWSTSQTFGQLGDTVPWDRQPDVVLTKEHQESERFQIKKGFGIQRILEDDAIGSLIGMTFNEFGHIIASKEGGPLLLIFDKDGDSIPESVRTYCDQVESCQGILALNGEVFVTGQGPEGIGLYRLSDLDRNGTLEKVELLLKFKGEPGEHGPHGITLGPDGMLYVSVGNHARVVGPEGKGETLPAVYEGDLVTPRFEDPGGHAKGIRAPGGMVIRTNVRGKTVERIAGGIRNAYDLAFLPDGGLFVHDSDMESDNGSAWYRPTALFNITEAGEFGWRSGWAKWPDYYVDRLPSTLDTGRGSPTGAICYQHYRFPLRYHGSLFLADWSEGRILNVRLKREGAGYDADSEIFLEGQPLNVTDLEVGPDGALYFCTGGRGTAGGLYRIVWEGPIPDRAPRLGSGITAAIRQPQLNSAWSRQKIAGIKKKLGSSWGKLVSGVAYGSANSTQYRLQAMDLMQLFGPLPSTALLIELSRAENESVRAKAAYMMGLHPTKKTAKRLVKMLEDRDLFVRRAACEAMLRSRQKVSSEAILPLLESDDRVLAYVARRVLETIPTDRWRDAVLETDSSRQAIIGSLALVTADPQEATSLKVLEKMSTVMRGFLTDADFGCLLRVMQVALEQGQVKLHNTETLQQQIVEEFPTGDARINRELIRLAVYLQAEDIATPAIEYVGADALETDRLHIAMYLSFLKRQWTAAERLTLFRIYEQAAKKAKSSSVPLYIMDVTRNFAKNITSEDAVALVERGEKWPNAALASLFKLSRPLNDESIDILIDLDRKIPSQEFNTDVYKRLRTGIVAMLSITDDQDAKQYLRKVWRSEPERRQAVAMGLAQNPEGKNWDYLVRSLNILDGDAAEEVLRQLLTVRVATDDPEALRQVILQGLRAVEENRTIEHATALLMHWTGLNPAPEDSKTMKPWQDWYAKTYTDRPPAELPTTDDEAKWDFDQLVSYLESDEGNSGDPMHGKSVFTKSQCAACHQVGEEGSSIGPDLTTVAKRFTRREVLESIMFPAHVISNQYMSKKVLTLDGKIYVGMISSDSSGRFTIRDSKNHVTTLRQDDIDQTHPSNSTIMPSGALDSLSLGEISDLMAFLGVVPATEVAKGKSHGRK